MEYEEKYNQSVMCKSQLPCSECVRLHDGLGSNCMEQSIPLHSSVCDPSILYLHDLASDLVSWHLRKSPMTMLNNLICHR